MALCDARLGLLRISITRIVIFGMENEPEPPLEPLPADESVKRFCLEGLRYSIESGQISIERGQELAKEWTGQVIRFRDRPYPRPETTDKRPSE